jgi:hypothetical protein
MHLANDILTDEAVHGAAARLREAFRLNPTTTNAQERADVDTILTWIMRQTELPAAYSHLEVEAARREAR